MKISKYTKLGILVIVSLAILIWGLNYLKGIDFFRKNTSYHVVYSRIDGLLESSAVTVNGYKVGQVTEIDFTKDNSGKLLVVFSLEGDFMIPKGSTARIVSSDLMGTKSIQLQINPGNGYYRPGDTIPGSTESDLKEQVSMQVLPLKKRAEELLSSLDSAITVVTYIFNERTRENLSQSFEHINQTVANIEQTSGELKGLIQKNSGSITSIIGNIDTLSTGFKNNSENFDRIVRNIKSMSDSLSGLSISPMITEISKAVESLNLVIGNLQQTDNSAGLLLNDPKLYENLNQLSSSLDLLLKDFRNNPKRYVHFSAFDFGKNVYITSKPKTPDENSPVVFKVHLISSPSQIPTNNRLFEELGHIEEIYISGVYNYMTGSSSDFDEISQLQDKARINFPDASIVAFKNGRKIKLERAVKNNK
ncbi:MAG: MlaD family protein [Prolixibacteraceae bacterium]|jgi:phospholipid/cholesterol/gamma-HCH transport system substrate-binding protein|nr:MlaD family protein [Prolixibacteraceae bacterium]